MFFEKFLPRVLDIEGPYSNDPDDKGGETICGIARKRWKYWEGWKIVDQMKANGQLPVANKALRDLAKDLYLKEFWQRIRGDDIKDEQVAWEVFEFGVNAGVSRASSALQRTLNLLNRNGKSWTESMQDGRIGPNTLANLNHALSERNGSRHICLLINGLQRMHYINFAERQPSQEKYMRGWLERTV